MVQDYIKILYGQTNATFPATLSKAADLIDSEISNKYLGRPYASIIDTDPKTTDYILMSSIILDLFYTPTQISATISSFFNHTLSNFKNSNKGGYKMVFYSAHDTTVMNLLVALNLTNFACVNASYYGGSQPDCITEYPRYASNAIF